MNTYRTDDADPLEVYKVDNRAVRAAQIAKLDQLRRERIRGRWTGRCARSRRRGPSSVTR